MKAVTAPILLFDYDGVIADSEVVFFREFTALCGELGFERIDSKEAFLALFEGNFLIELVKVGFPVRKLKRLARAFRPRFAEMNRRVPPFEGMPELLRDLSQAFPVYVITSNSTDTILSFLERHGIDTVQDVLGADKETSKVKKIRSVRRKHRGQTAYYVGDTKGDMIEARQAKALPIGVAWGWHSVEKLREGNPEAIVNTPEELRAFFLST